MPDAFGPVLFAVCGLSILGAVVALISMRKTWEDYGKSSRLIMDRDLPQEPARGSSAALVERDAEIRQLLEARNLRRERRGEPRIDVEQELARLTRPKPHVDAALRAEIRQLVIARNHRRTRAGKPALDVEAEIERQIEALGDMGLG
jgi:hypothetical protein